MRVTRLISLIAMSLAPAVTSAQTGSQLPSADSVRALLDRSVANAQWMVARDRAWLDSVSSGKLKADTSMIRKRRDGLDMNRKTLTMMESSQCSMNNAKAATTEAGKTQALVCEDKYYQAMGAKSANDLDSINDARHAATVAKADTLHRKTLADLARVQQSLDSLNRGLIPMDTTQLRKLNARRAQLDLSGRQQDFMMCTDAVIQAYKNKPGDPAMQEKYKACGPRPPMNVGGSE